MSTHVVNAVKRQLKDSAITFTDEWFEACVNWVIENNSSSQVTQEHLKNEVMGQWMDADLSELNSSCLPPKLADTKLVALPGRYSLQVNYAEDIGESSYNQWNKLKKLENENTNVSADTDSTEIKASWEPKARRCVYLTMTDGSQEVYGMEMVPIPCISVEIKPGTKITISGPVDCRRGVFQLHPRNVRVIGGEVEGLIEQYAREKILKSRLHQDGHQQPSRPVLPRPIYKKPPASLSSKSKGKLSGATQSLSTNNNSSSYGRSTQPQSNPNSRKSPRKWNGGGKSDEPQPVHPELEGIDFGDDEDDPFGDDDADFMDIDETLLISQASRTNRADQTTQHISQPSSFGSQNGHQGSAGAGAGRQHQHDQTTLPLTQQRDRGRSGVSSSDGKDVKFKPSTSASAFTETSHFKQPPVPVPVPAPSFSDIKYQPPVPASSSGGSSTKFKPPPSASTSTSSSSFSQQRPKRKEEIPEIVIIDDDDDDDEDDELFANISMIGESKISRPESPPSKKMKIISKIPYQYIKVIKDNLEQFDRGHIVFVKACVATLLSNIKMGQDGGWSLIVSLNDGSGFLEAPISSEMLNRVIGFTPAEMKRMKASGDSSAKNKITSGMSNLSTKLCHMNGIFGIKILPSGPVITSFTQVEHRHVLALKGRLAEIS